MDKNVFWKEFFGFLRNVLFYGLVIFCLWTCWKPEAKGAIDPNLICLAEEWLAENEPNQIATKSISLVELEAMSQNWLKGKDWRGGGIYKPTGRPTETYEACNPYDYNQSGRTDMNDFNELSKRWKGWEQ